MTGMYAGYFTYVCEDCEVREKCDRGQVTHIYRFNHAHLGHRKHINDFGRPGITLVKFLGDIDREDARFNRNQRIISILTLGRRGKERAKPWPEL